MSNKTFTNINEETLFQVIKPWRDSGMILSDIVFKLEDEGYRTSSGKRFETATLSSCLIRYGGDSYRTFKKKGSKRNVEFKRPTTEPNSQTDMKALMQLIIESSIPFDKKMNILKNLM